MKIDKSSPEAKHFIISVMDNLELVKANLADVSESAGLRDIMTQACKLLAAAEKMDHAQNYTKNIVKCYFSAALLFESLKVFEAYDNSQMDKAKFAKWRSTYRVFNNLCPAPKFGHFWKFRFPEGIWPKIILKISKNDKFEVVRPTFFNALYIHTCLSKGEQPSPPEKDAGDDELESELDRELAELDELDNLSVQRPTNVNTSPQLPSFRAPQRPVVPKPQISQPQVFQPQAPQHQFNPPPQQFNPAPVQTGYPKLDKPQVERFKKLLKFSSSALETYSDTPGAIEQLEKALKLLRTGQEWKTLNFLYKSCKFHSNRYFK